MDLSLRREDREQPDDVVLREQRYGDHRFDSRLRRRVADSGKAWIRGNVLYDQHPAGTERPESQLEQPVGKPFMRACEAEPGSCVEALVVAQVDRKAVRVEQLSDVRHRGLERVREREL